MRRGPHFCLNGAIGMRPTPDRTGFSTGRLACQTGRSRPVSHGDHTASAHGLVVAAGQLGCLKKVTIGHTEAPTEMAVHKSCPYTRWS